MFYSYAPPTIALKNLIKIKKNCNNIRTNCRQQRRYMYFFIRKGMNIVINEIPQWRGIVGYYSLDDLNKTIFQERINPHMIRASVYFDNNS